MLDLKYIDTVRWDKELGQRLQALRGNMSRRKLAEKSEELGNKVSHQYIQQLEQPEVFIQRKNALYLTVSIDIIKTLCTALGAEVYDLFDSAKITVTH